MASLDECEAVCTAEPACNAASFYLDGSKYGNKNCWLKTLAPTCSTPTDASTDENATLIWRLQSQCALPPESLRPIHLVRKYVLGPFLLTVAHQHTW